MRFTDIFIQRPVLATVVSLLILLLGARAAMEMEIRQYPELESTTVTVTTAYPGAGSELVKGFITTPLQQAIAEASGIDYLTSTSSQGQSTIEAKMVLNYDANAALAEIQAKVASQRNVLPADAQDPVITSTTGDSTALMYIAFYSDELEVPQITDYLTRVVQPKLQALSGVGKADLLGRQFALRVWLDPERLSAVDMTPQEVVDVLLRNNYQAAVGNTKGKYTKISMTSDTDVGDPEQFKDLVVKESDGSLIRLRDIARVELGSETYDQLALYKGQPATYVAIELSPGANPLTVAKLVKDELPGIESQLPSGMNVRLAYDASDFIDSSIKEVIQTLLEALVIVLVVVFICLGSVRAAVVPSVAVPLSLVGGAFFMLMMGFSLNLLTLLSMVLAIGLVVDDAIIMVENVHRHIEEGESRFNAALNGAREMATPIIAMTTTLVAVYAPIGFMGGLVGSLFTEFAFTLAGTVVISGIVALTLSPMLSGKILKPHGNPGRFEQVVERSFGGLANGYKRALASLMDTKSVVIFFAIVVLGSIYFMVAMSQNELAPTEDQGILFYQGLGPQTSTLDYLQEHGDEVQERMSTVPGYHEDFMILGITGPNAVFGGFKMKPWSERDISQFEVQPQLDQELKNVTGLQTAVFPRPSLPGSGGGLPFQFVITTGEDYERLNDVANDLLGQAMQSGNFMFLQKSIDFDRPVTRINVDRDRVADLGLSMQDVGRAMSSMLGGGYINRFNMQGRSYQVIPQVDQDFRLDEQALNDYYIRADSGSLVPLSSVISFQKDVEPSQRTQFNQLNSLTLQGVVTPGVTVGDAMAFMENAAADSFPQGFSFDYTGESRQFANQGSALVVTFFLSLLVIYLVLAAQFESWRDPFIILVSVPMSVAGAMAFIVLGFATMNIYTQVGLITLIGVVSKNGILIVEFANQLQVDKGLNKREAVVEAAAIRLRPIVMTSLALIFAMVPLLIAVGPGAESRFAIGLTISAGLGIGTLFTIFVLPAFYILLGRDHHGSAADDDANGSTGNTAHAQ
ncbi:MULTISPECIES: efflux RND transporter permease subunit [Marinobacter]|jgi:multidrug efflux pump|uniref:efflux RND transporter permease subunit n=2 Tax=Marinobacteraceae TaxID=2887365 RepID=UPI00055A5F2A|nr:MULTISPECIES: efflux RND transporter permease subunit [Marinobacter]AZR41654.1 putative transporter [Marinobacter salarius]MAB50735.1 multidrug efflux protein [Marinobacter sp.]|tara:strand:+ start:532 stop:3615 length:3084 start_codon:yes stop_codon:yes gene_type:complete